MSGQFTNHSEMTCVDVHKKQLLSNQKGWVDILFRVKQVNNNPDTIFSLIF